MSKDLVAVSSVDSDLEVFVAPTPPESLKGRGLVTWALLWEIGANVYQEVDSFLVERYCTEVNHWLDLVNIIEEEGFICSGANEQPVAHPAVKLKTTSEVSLEKMESRLGLSPEARLKLTGNDLSNQAKKTALGAMVERLGSADDSAPRRRT